MGRPRKFDEANVVQQAMLAFWQCGYESTTIRSLQEATGVDGKGLANVFGDKEQLFLRALDTYTQMASQTLEQVFATPSIEAIGVLFQAFVADPADVGDPRRSGCLVVNTVFELGPSTEPIRERIASYRALFIHHFQAALAASGVDDPSGRAEFLLAMWWGALSQVRLAGSTQAAKPVVEQIQQTLQHWAAQAATSTD
ncbi:MAG: TetR/AcrR family transcriptional regulator [Pseudomonadota bacterium]